MKTAGYAIWKEKTKQWYHLVAGYRTADNFPIYNQTDHYLVSLSIDACEPLQHNLTTHYALVKRGSCSDYTKAVNLQRAGAAAVIFYSLQGQDTTIDLISVPIPVTSISYESGQHIRDLLYERRSESSLKNALHTPRVIARLTTTLTTLSVKSGGMISAFSTLGPTNELELKPDISAVGGFVFSTIPRYLGSYGTISGTSMSSPWIAGSIALLLGYNKTLTPQQVTSAIMNFAEPGKCC